MKVGKETEIYNNGYADGYEAAMRLEIPDPDYWTRLEHQYAGMAMQGLMSLSEWPEETTDVDVIETASKYAHALVEKMKNKEE